MSDMLKTHEYNANHSDRIKSPILLKRNFLFYKIFNILPPPSQFSSLTEMDLDKMTVSVLKQECKKYGLNPQNKKKGELIEMIKEHLAAEKTNKTEEVEQKELPKESGIEREPGEIPTEEEKKEMRRKRFGPVESEEERIKIEERKKRFGTNN